MSEDVKRRFSWSMEWENRDMKGTAGALLRRPLIIAFLTLSIVATSVTSAGASSSDDDDRSEWTEGVWRRGDSFGARGVKGFAV